MQRLLVFVLLGLLTIPDQPASGRPVQESGSASPPGDGVTVPEPTDSDTDAGQAEPEQPFAGLNIPLKTIGGTQLWTDHLWRDGYRLQQQAMTGHWRVVDRGNVRRGWGSRAHCQQRLDQLAPPQADSQAAKHYVVLLHGLMRTHHSMGEMESALDEAGFDVIRFSYASSRGSISEHAAALREVLTGLPPNTQFSFVGHSMGGIVIRHLIGDLERDPEGDALLSRFHCLVMLGSPNQGAAIARRLAPTGVFKWVTGKGGMQLGPEWDEFVQHLGTPDFPFAIIAGDVSDKSIQNPLIDGSGDYIVAVEEARLEGAEAFHVLPVIHSFLMRDEAAIKLTIDFLKAHAPQAG
jgi:pimeloyl-ACP methyl ester carboxylesterase